MDNIELSKIDISKNKVNEHKRVTCEKNINIKQSEINIEQ